MLKKLCFVFAAALIAAVLPGCGGGGDKIQPPDYADNITETMLKALNNNDYQSYCQAFTNVMKQATTEEYFNTNRTFTLNKIGRYESKKVSSVSENGTTATVVYSAKFVNEPDDATVHIVFDTSGDNVAVSAFWIVSPKLFEH
ncbi:MAG: DUF3887 domain-containing protein [Dehalococcoidales bacterium]